MLGSYIFSFIRNWWIFSELLYLYMFLPAMYKWFHFSTSLKVFSVVTIFYFRYSDRFVENSHCGFNMHFSKGQCWIFFFMLNIFNCDELPSLDPLNWNVSSCLFPFSNWIICCVTTDVRIPHIIQILVFYELCYSQKFFLML